MAGNIKREDIQPCLLCGEGLMHDNAMTFTRVTVERFVVDLSALRRQHGLEMMIGNPFVAHVMGPHEDLAVALGEPVSGLICLNCSARPASVYGLAERMEAAAAKGAGPEGAESAEGEGR